MVPPRWSPPPWPWIKINTDAALVHDHAVCAAIARDAKGIPIFALSDNVQCLNPLVLFSLPSE
ncbi:hypothetical protein TorRG33x02_178140 [Trema orientale]|uniref:RNase H type-1 domain-containing protein n=1 Tax=Trema orientale TaxID=63057 RepID=A0A2P5ELG2_TREOI|nr:hypothetical protein TorRG33x02_178140 [Trema orientale]